MVITAQDLIEKCFKDCGLKKLDEPLTNTELADALLDLNMLVAALGLDPTMATALEEEPFTLIAGKQYCTIGVGGDFNTTKPYKIFDSNIMDSDDNNYEITAISMEQYITYEDG